MFFLIRVAFWLSIVILLIPTGSTQPPGQGSQIGALDALSAASAAVSDMRNFCARQPDACEKGSQAAAAFGQKAQAGAKLVYEFLTERLHEDAGPAAGKSADAGVTGTVKPSQNTLTPADKAPAWRGPQPARPEMQARRAS